jgi:type 2 lantibiotic biosynthesis protein LanM
MNEPTDRIEVIWTRSRTLDELLDQGSPTFGKPSSSHDLADWVRAFSPGDEDALRRRLEWDAIEPARAEAALRGHMAFPAANESFRRAVTSLVELASQPPATDASLAEIPFILLWEPFVGLARQGVSGDETLLTDDAWADLTRNLALQLAWCGTPSAWQAFDTLRERESVGHHAFCQAFRDDPLAFFVEHAVLLRRLVTLTRQWSEATSELLDRLDDDRLAIEQLTGGAAIPIARIRPGVSDRHHEGRQVAILTAASGRRFVYKPRTSHSLARFNDLLRWYSTVDPELAPKTIDVVEREGYAWIEFIEQASFDTEDDVRDYYRRSGALLFFAWLLGGRDLHMDNIIASKRSAVIVDTEVFAQPAWSSGASTGALQVARDRISSSVVGTAMLSFPQQDDSGTVYDIGGLTGAGGYLSPPRRRWHDVNTDTMRFTEERRAVDPMENVVRVGESIARPGDFIDEIVDGFAAAFHAALEHRDHLVAPGGPLDRFRETDTRLLFRPSNQYATLLKLLVSPACSRLGITASLYVESLARVFSRLDSRPDLWPLVREERAALERLDIPLFTIRCSRNEIRSESGEVIRGLIGKTGVEALLDRMRTLDSESLLEQTRLIAATLVSSKPHEGQEDETPLTAFHAPAPGATAAGIDHIAEVILGAAVEGDDGAATWIAPEYVKIDSLADLGATYYLYSGVTGISLFLAAWGDARGNERARRLARAAWVPLERLLESGDLGDARDHLRIGIANGIGSIAYAAALASQLLDDPSLLAVATGFGEMLTEDRLRSEGALDIEGGVAGASLALHSLYLVTSDSQWLDRSTIAARRLVSESIQDAAGRYWRSDSSSPPLAGMAHGAAGIGLALATTGRSMDDAPLIEAATQAFDWERSRFDEETGNWPVHTTDGRKIDMIAWCHGAPGVGMSRIGAALEHDRFRTDIELAARATRASGIHPVDHVCCGNAGRIDFLIEAASALDDTLILEEARHRAGAIVSRANHKGRFTLVDEDHSTFRPGFFRGLAGIGYTLLRVLDPSSFPSVTRFKLRGDPQR